ncbi:MAG: hypothetical protein Q9218_005485 [Villophora microphyllina]
MSSSRTPSPSKRRDISGPLLPEPKRRRSTFPTSDCDTWTVRQAACPERPRRRSEIGHRFHLVRPYLQAQSPPDDVPRNRHENVSPASKQTVGTLVRPSGIKLPALAEGYTWVQGARSLSPDTKASLQPLSFELPIRSQYHCHADNRDSQSPHVEPFPSLPTDDKLPSRPSDAEAKPHNEGRLSAASSQPLNLPLLNRPLPANDGQESPEAKSTHSHSGRSRWKSVTSLLEAAAFRGMMLEHNQKMKQADRKAGKKRQRKPAKIIKAQQRTKRLRRIPCRGSERSDPKEQPPSNAGSPQDVRLYPRHQDSWGQKVETESLQIPSSLVASMSPMHLTRSKAAMMEKSHHAPKSPHPLHLSTSSKSPSPFDFGSPESNTGLIRSIEPESSVSPDDLWSVSPTYTDPHKEANGRFRRGNGPSPSQSPVSDRVVDGSSPEYDKRSNETLDVSRLKTRASKTDQDETPAKVGSREVSPWSKRFPNSRASPLVPASVIAGDSSHKASGRKATGASVEEAQLIDAKASCTFSHPSCRMLDFAKGCTKEVHRPKAEAMGAGLEHCPGCVAGEKKPSRIRYNYTKSICNEIPEHLPLIIFPIRTNMPRMQSDDGLDGSRRARQHIHAMPQDSPRSSSFPPQLHQGGANPPQEGLTENDNQSSGIPVFEGGEAGGAGYQEERANSSRGNLSEDQDLPSGSRRQSVNFNERRHGSHSPSRDPAEPSSNSRRQSDAYDHTLVGWYESRAGHAVTADSSFGSVEAERPPVRMPSETTTVERQIGFLERDAALSPQEAGQVWEARIAWRAQQAHAARLQQEIQSLIAGPIPLLSQAIDRYSLSANFDGTLDVGARQEARYVATQLQNGMEWRLRMEKEGKQGTRLRGGANYDSHSVTSDAPELTFEAPGGEPDLSVSPVHTSRYVDAWLDLHGVPSNAPEYVLGAQEDEPGPPNPHATSDGQTANGDCRDKGKEKVQNGYPKNSKAPMKPVELDSMPAAKLIDLPEKQSKVGLLSRAPTLPLRSDRRPSPYLQQDDAQLENGVHKEQACENSPVDAQQSPQAAETNKRRKHAKKIPRARNPFGRRPVTAMRYGEPGWMVSFGDGTYTFLNVKDGSLLYLAKTKSAGTIEGKSEAEEQCLLCGQRADVARTSGQSPNITHKQYAKSDVPEEQQKQDDTRKQQRMEGVKVAGQEKQDEAEGQNSAFGTHGQKDETGDNEGPDHDGRESSSSSPVEAGCCCLSCIGVISSFCTKIRRICSGRRSEEEHLVCLRILEDGLAERSNLLEKPATPGRNSSEAVGGLSTAPDEGSSQDQRSWFDQQTTAGNARGRSLY